MTNPHPVKSHARDLSPAGQAAESWLRQLARTLKVCRLYRGDNPIVVKAIAHAIEGLQSLVDKHGQMNFRFTVSEIWRADECLIKADRAGGDPSEQLGKLGELAVQFFRELPLIFYRDGVRRVTIHPSVSRGEMEAFFDALRAWGGASNPNDDLVTMLWQANLDQIVVESVPIEQIIYLSAEDAPAPPTADEPKAGYTYAGEQLHADLGQGAGFQGLHKDTFDDWEAPESTATVTALYGRLQPAMESALWRFRSMWEDEHGTDWRKMAPDVLRMLLELDPGDETHAAVSHAVATWVVDALQRFSWEEARGALDLLLEFDSTLERSAAELAEATRHLDVRGIVERLDEAEPEEAGRFAAVLAVLGPCAVNLACTVLARTNNARTRAAAATALSYICAEQPGLLEPYVGDSRAPLVQSIAFVLGQIGGPEVANLLHLAAQHPDPRVRRQVVMSLGSVPLEQRLPILLEQLTTDDMQLLGAALNLLTREKNEGVARALAGVVTAPGFETRSETVCRAIYVALGDVAGDEAVPALEAQLIKGGWLAGRTLERSAAARALERIGTAKALAVLEAGLKSRSKAVRNACLDAMSQKGGT